MPLRMRLLLGWNRIFSHGYHQVTVAGTPRFAGTGPGILVCNHISGLDPLLLQSVVKRPVVWMMAREYYDIAALRWIFVAMESIPVERSGRDSAATRAALRALDQGKLLGVFPEGRIATKRELLPFQPGVAMLAARAGATVYPASLEGTNRGMEMVRAFLTPNEVTIRFGSPLHPPPAKTPKADLEDFGESIRQSIAKLFDA